MCLNFIILCFLLITQVFGASVLNTYTQLKIVASQKCPLMENSIFLIPEPDFLKNCDSVDANLLKQNALSTKNEDSVLCFVYFSVFQRLCERIGLSNYDFSGLSKTINETLKKSSINDVCFSLGKINDLGSKYQFILSALQSPGYCNRLCTDYGQLRNICTWTSFMWSFNEALESELKQQMQRKPIISQHDKSNINAGTLDAVTETLESNNDKEKLKAPEFAADTSIGSLTKISNLETRKNELLHNLPDAESVITSETLPKMSNKVDVPKDTQNNGKQFLDQNLKNIKLSPMASPSQDNKSTISEGSLTKQQTQKTSGNNINKGSSNANTLTGTGDKQLVNTLEVGINTKKIEDLPAKQPSIISDSHKELSNPSDDNPKKVNVESVTNNTELKDSKNEVKEKQIEKGDNNNKDSVIDVPKEDVNYDVDEGGDNDFENINDDPPKQTKEKAIDEKMTLKDQNIYGNEPPPKSSEVKQKPVEVAKPREIDEDSSNLAANFQNQNIDDSDSYFFSYFMMVCVMFICGYVAYHNKQKILALVLEGRKGRRPSRSRRPNSANYRKLDTTLEEAVTSSCDKNTTQVIY